MHSQLQDLGHAREERCSDPAWRQRRSDAEKLLRFAIEMCQLQHSLGGTFLHEHPLPCESWKESSVQQLLQQPGVVLTSGD
eukprot:4438909-Alexandrium_andersonii.AAC.1